MKSEASQNSGAIAITSP